MDVARPAPGGRVDAALGPLVRGPARSRAVPRPVPRAPVAGAAGARRAGRTRSARWSGRVDGCPIRRTRRSAWRSTSRASCTGCAVSWPPPSRPTARRAEQGREPAPGLRAAAAGAGRRRGGRAAAIRRHRRGEPRPARPAGAAGRGGRDPCSPRATSPRRADARRRAGRRRRCRRTRRRCCRPSPTTRGGAVLLAAGAADAALGPLRAGVRRLAATLADAVRRRRGPGCGSALACRALGDDDAARPRARRGARHVRAARRPARPRPSGRAGRAADASAARASPRVSARCSASSRAAGPTGRSRPSS